MKKFILSLGLGLALVSGTVSAAEDLDLLNTRAYDILSPYKNKKTRAQLEFKYFEQNDKIVAFTLNGLYSKKSPHNKFALKIDNFKYNDFSMYREPMMVLKGSLNFDFEKYARDHRTDTRDVIPLMVSIIHQVLQGYTEPYGDAGSINSIITSSTPDDEYTKMTVLYSAKIDLSKLSDEEKRNSVQFTELTMSLTLDLKKGIMVDAYLIKNQESTDFLANELKIKEFFDALLSGDQSTLSEVNEYIQQLDDFAEQAVGLSKGLQLDTFTQFLKNNKK